MIKPFEIELLKSVDKEFKEEFYKYSKTIEYHKGSSPFSSDSLLRFFYIILEGKVKTYQINFETSKEQTLFIYKRGDMFDVVSLLDGEPHEIGYEVLEDCRVLEFPIHVVRGWINNNPTFSKIFFPYLASKIRYAEDLACEISLYEVRERFIHLLLESVNPKSKFKYAILKNLSNSEIAKLLGTVRHVIERVLKQLKAEKIIQTHRKNIIVINIQKLLEKSDKMLLK